MTTEYRLVTCYNATNSSRLHQETDQGTSVYTGRGIVLSVGLEESVALPCTPVAHGDITNSHKSEVVNTNVFTA